MTATTRRKLAAVLMAMIIFACLGAVTSAAVGRPVEIGAFNAVLIGAGIGLFEEFYVQGSRGNWMREMHPLRAIFVYILVVIVLYLIAVHVTHLVLGRLDDLPVVYRRLPYGITFFTTFSIVGILMIRVAHFIGLRTLLDLVIGTYHRPVEERKVLLFLDINGSTALAELTMRSFVRKFLSDVSQPIVDCGGEIYLYKGDGLIAVWNWADAVKADAILKAVDAMFATVAKQRDAYQRLFGAAPTFRVAIHGGPVIVSELGRRQAIDRHLWRCDQYRRPHGRGGAGPQRPLRDIRDRCASAGRPQPRPSNRHRAGQGHFGAGCDLRIRVRVIAAEVRASVDGSRDLRQACGIAIDRYYPEVRHAPRRGQQIPDRKRGGHADGRVAASVLDPGALVRRAAGSRRAAEEDRRDGRGTARLPR
jgi:hypothetical protein